jgi:hypothetical protein
MEADVAGGETLFAGVLSDVHQFVNACVHELMK